MKLFECLYAPLTAGLLSPLSADRQFGQQNQSQLDRLYPLSARRRRSSLAQVLARARKLSRLSRPRSLRVPPETLRLVTWQRMSFSEPVGVQRNLGPVEHLDAIELWRQGGLARLAWSTPAPKLFAFEAVGRRAVVAMVGATGIEPVTPPVRREISLKFFVVLNDLYHRLADVTGAYIFARCLSNGDFRSIGPRGAGAHRRRQRNSRISRNFLQSLSMFSVRSVGRICNLVHTDQRLTGYLPGVLPWSATCAVLCSIIFTV